MLNTKNFIIDYKNKKPNNFKKYKIGIIGAGNIVENSHLPIYEAEKLNIINIFDTNIEKAKFLKKKYDIINYSNNIEEFFNDKNIDIVDIAVPAEFNHDLFQQALNYNKHILIQKPLSNNLDTAKKILTKYRNANIKANVNHQMRYSPSIKAANYLIKKNYFGQIKSFKFYTHRKTDWSIWPWLSKIDYPELRYNSIHYLDSIRCLFGNPNNVKAELIHSRNSILDKPTNIYVTFKYNNGLTGVLDITHDSKNKPEDWIAGFEIIGVNGNCKGIISSMIGNGTSFPDKITFSYYKNNKLHSYEKELEGRWFSECFAGPMFSLFNAIEFNIQPETNIYDAFETLNLVEEVIKSQH